MLKMKSRPFKTFKVRYFDREQVKYNPLSVIIQKEKTKKVRTKMTRLQLAKKEIRQHPANFVFEIKRIR